MKNKLSHKLFCISTVFIVGVSGSLINKSYNGEAISSIKNNVVLGNLMDDNLADTPTNVSTKKPPAVTTGFQMTIGKKVITSTTANIIYVNLPLCKVYIYKNVKKKAALVRTMPCAPGRRMTSTVKGLFKSQRVAVWVHDVKYNCYLKYVTRITGGYLFHAQPMNSKGQVISRVMGVPASHGCVRLYPYDAQYIYQDVPSGSTIYIK